MIVDVSNPEYSVIIDIMNKLNLVKDMENIALVKTLLQEKNNNKLEVINIIYQT